MCSPCFGQTRGSAPTKSNRIKNPQTVLRRTVGAPLVGARNGRAQAQGLPYMRDDRRRRIQNAYGLVILLDAFSWYSRKTGQAGYKKVHYFAFGASGIMH